MRKSRKIRIFKSKKEIIQGILPCAIVNVERGLGAIAANAGTNTINKLIEKKSPGSKLKKAVPAAMLILGTVIDATVDNKYATAPFQGMVAESGRRLFVDLVPETVLTKINLSGLNNNGTQKRRLSQSEVEQAINELEKERQRGTSGTGAFDGALNGEAKA